MTICAAAICENNSKIVIASDRMITATYPSIEFEHAIPKFEILSPRCVALTAGSALEHTELFRHAKSELGQIANPSIAVITEKIKNRFVEQRINRAEELYLKPRGLTLRGFYENHGSISPDITMRLDNMIEKTNLELEILVCGLDYDGCHLHYILDPGTSVCFDSLGYTAIGSGAIHAVSNFIFRGTSPLTPLNETVYAVYEGKRIAENSPGVGRVTDMAILDNDGIKNLLEEDLNILKDIYEKQSDLKRKISEGLDTVKDLSIFKKGG